MSFKNRLSGWMPSGPKAWLIVILGVFILLMCVYQILVEPSSDTDPNTYTLPNKKSIDVSGKELSSSTFNAPASDNNSVDPVQQVATPKALPHMVEHVIKSGETLDGIFQKLGFSRQDMYAILEADEEYLVLDPLIPGDTLIFTTDKDGKLQSLSRRLDPSKSIAYVRHDGGGFTYKEYTKPINYVQEAEHGTINGSFYWSAKKLGLSDANIVIVRDLLKGRFDFRRDIRAGDAFDVVLKKGDVDGKPVGSDQLEALQITVKGHTYRAFLYSDGRFYDEHGNSLTPALLRWPTKIHYRVTSPFNPHRRHPITGRLAPHNGTDLGAPSGTKVFATGDGVVTRVAYQKYAGKYLDINNIGIYSTRFLHLSKILVKRGQHVKRGQVIALSGNTGRTTGPHLHYELHVNGKPVDPMKAKIPTLQSIPKSKMKAFKEHVKRWIAMMNQQPY
ncbi:Murein DD-endopeptidase MepM [Marinomonas spartinae]|uniref:Murein DD-endopeptidase MepM n=1 Tax=Marinomonas spartinae TaxID=1792290 RepID=A0A1A8TR00_9GAMM|nr:peptidoglycan DD-metalloendopeptidase family protein [Marinomonas spartinae]SBS35300.1 Murein DD-endopeptidase MepM [Marinomonas spartinae]